MFFISILMTNLALPSSFLLLTSVVPQLASFSLTLRIHNLCHKPVKVLDTFAFVVNIGFLFTHFNIKGFSGSPVIEIVKLFHFQHYYKYVVARPKSFLFGIFY